MVSGRRILEAQYYALGKERGVELESYGELVLDDWGKGDKLIRQI